MNPKKISVIGNACGGKTVLSRRLSSKFSLPCTHVDSIQFLPGMKIRPHGETIQILRQKTLEDVWIIDGYGPLDILEERLLISDLIVFVDLSIARHFYWAFKRQLQILYRPRVELSLGCHELNISHFLKLLRSIWITHKKMRPELLKILSREHFKNKTVFIRSVSSMKDF